MSKYDDDDFVEDRNESRKLDMIKEAPPRLKKKLTKKNKPHPKRYHLPNPAPLPRPSFQSPQTRLATYRNGLKTKRANVKEDDSDSYNNSLNTKRANLNEDSGSEANDESYSNSNDSAVGYDFDWRAERLNEEMKALKYAEEMKLQAEAAAAKAKEANN
jgi:hypothetical protein